VLGPALPGSADPKPTEKELKAQLATLRRQVDSLIATYNAKRVALRDAQKREKAARERLRSAGSAYAAAQRQVVRLAGLSYQSTGLDLPALMAGPGGGGASIGGLDGAAVLEQMAAERAAELDAYAEARDARRKAAREAAELTKDIRQQADDVRARREKAEKLIEQIKDRLDRMVPTAPGKRAGGGWAPELPGGSDNITPRTRLIREEIKKNFALKFSIGCFRAGGGGEHPLGRACDYMLSSGGTMPSADEVRLGHEIADWAIKNAGRLGVMYVIYRQRIYNIGMPGWRAMEDRGSITANHFDHVHISMY
jgi:hypothetical protein